MLFYMQKTRLDSGTRHGIGDHGIDGATEVGVVASASLQSLLYLQATFWTEKSAAAVAQNRARTAKNQTKNRIAKLPKSKWTVQEKYLETVIWPY